LAAVELVCERMRTHTAMNNLQKNLIDDFSQKVRSFVRFVGCANIHADPEAHIAELHLFYSTTIDFFARLQDKYVEKELENKRLRHYISALEFRFLLEKLTSSCPPGKYSDKNSGPRWQLFWKEALEKKYDQHVQQVPGAPEHALKAIIDAHNPRRGRIDQVTGAKIISSNGQPGQVFRTGRDLYGTLSDEIHHCEGREYDVGYDDDWTKLVVDTIPDMHVCRSAWPARSADDAATSDAHRARSFNKVLQLRQACIIRNREFMSDPKPKLRPH
jgi:hypothetical protein